MKYYINYNDNYMLIMMTCLFLINDIMNLEIIFYIVLVNDIWLIRSMYV